MAEFKEIQTFDYTGYQVQIFRSEVWRKNKINDSN